MSDVDPLDACAAHRQLHPAGVIADATEISALRSYLRRKLRDTDDVDDMVQDVYLRVLAAPTEGPIENIRGFLRRIASNLLIDRYRSRVVRMTEFHDQVDEHMVDHLAIRPDRIFEGRQELARLGDALKSISPVARDAFLLVRVEGYSHKEAALRLGITPKAVSHHIDRTLAKLAERLLESVA